MSKLGENIKKERELRQLTQIELGKMLGVSKQTVSSWETGDKIPRVKTLDALAEILDTTVDELLGKTSINNVSEKSYNIAKEISELEEEDRRFIIKMIKNLKSKKDK